MNIKKMLKATAFAGVFAMTASTFAAPSIEVFPAGKFGTDSGATKIFDVDNLGTASTTRIANEVYEADKNQATIAGGVMLFTCDDVAASQIVIDFAGMTPSAGNYILCRLATTGAQKGKLQPLYSAGADVDSTARLVTGVIDNVNQTLSFAAEAGTNLRVGAATGVALAKGDKLVVVNNAAAWVNGDLTADAAAPAIGTYIVNNTQGANDVTFGLTGTLDKNLTTAVTMTAEETVADVTDSATSDYAVFANQFEVSVTKSADGIINVDDKDKFTVADNITDDDRIVITIDNLAVDTANETADNHKYILQATEATATTEPVKVTVKSSSKGALDAVTVTSDVDTSAGYPAVAASATTVVVTGDHTTIDTTGVVIEVEDDNLYGAGARGFSRIGLNVSTDATTEIVARDFTYSAVSVDEAQANDAINVNNAITYQTDAAAGSWGNGSAKFRIPAVVHSPAQGVNSTIRIGNNAATTATVTAYVAYNGDCKTVTLPTAAACSVTDYTAASIVAAIPEFAGKEGNFDVRIDVGSGTAEVECYITAPGAFTNARVIEETNN